MKNLMSKNNMSFVVQFAILWGEAIGSAIISSKALEMADEMKAYESDELLEIFSDWADEYISSTEENSVDFFNEKLTNLLH